MATPVITSVTPNTGRTLGDAFVEILGTDFGLPSLGMSVKVFFGGVEAPRADAITSNRILAMTPGGFSGVVDVRVDNITPGVPPAADIIETGVLASAYTYKRPSLASSGAISDYTPVALVGRRLVEELKRTVIDNTVWAMNIEYADVFSASFDEAKNATAPSLKLSGPTIIRDRFYGSNSEIETSDGLGSFTTFRRPFSVALTFDYVGLGRTKAESISLFNSLHAYFDRTPFLRVFSNGVDDTDGHVDLEMSVVWDQVGRFSSRAGRQSIFEFQGSFQIRGVWLFCEKIDEGKENLNILFTSEQF